MDLQKVTLPLLILDVEHNDQKQALAHVLNQHDAGYVQPFILNSGDDAYDVPAEDFHFRASLPDNQIIDVDNSDGSLVQKGDQNWLLNLPTGVTEAPGLVKCVVYAKDNGRVLASSQQITYNVMPEFDVDDVNHISYVSDFDKLKAKLTDLVGKAQEQLDHSGTTQPDLTGYAKTADVNKELDTKADKTALANYALKSDITQPDLSAYAKVTALEDYATKQALDAYALKTDLPDLTAYAKKSDLPAPVDLTGYAKKADLPDVSGLETKADHENDVKKINETLETYAKKSDLPDVSGLETKADHKADVDKLNKALDSKADKTALDSYALKSDVPAPVDLTGYAKKSDLPTVPSLDGYAKTEDVDQKLDTKANKTDLAAYETSANHKADIDKLNKALEGKADVSAIPALPDMSKYALKTDLKNVDLTGYLTKDDADRLLGEKANESELADYAKKTDLPPVPDLAIYAKVTDVAKALNNKADKDALTEYAKTEDVNKVNTTAANANRVAYMAMQNSISAINISRNSVQGIQVDGGRPADKDKYGWVNLQLGLSDYIKKADADNEYVKKTDIPAIPDTSSFVTTDSLTDALSNYALKSDVPANSGATSIKAMKQVTITDSVINLSDPSIYTTYTADKNGQINVTAPVGAFPCVARVVLDHNNTYSDSTIASQLSDYYPGYIFKFPDNKYYLDGHQLVFSDDMPVKKSDLDALIDRVAALEQKLNQ